MTRQQGHDGIVYTETVVYAPPEQYAADAPYQLAIIDTDDERRITVRILGRQASDRVQIGDRVCWVEDRDGVAYYEREETAR